MRYLLDSSPFQYNAGMGIFYWLAAHGFELLQTAGIIGGLLFTTYTVRKDAQTRQISNLIALNERHDQIWSSLYEHLQVPRVLDSDVNLNEQPVSDVERLFVKRLFIHLDTVHRTSKAGLFVEMEGIRNDVRSFMSPDGSIAALHEHIAGCAEDAGKAKAATMAFV